MNKLNPCPVNFHNSGSFCYTVIEKTTYPPKCPNPHVMFFEEYIKQIDENIFPIWMPVERDRSYGVGKSNLTYLDYRYERNMVESIVL